MTSKKSNPARVLPDNGIGLLSPAEMFGRALPGAFLIDAHLSFEERVERAWRHIKATRFEEDEYERLREVLMERLSAEGRHRASANGYAASDVQHP
jgi:hypothetical protein